MQNAGLDDSQTVIKIARRNINNLSYADDSTLMAEIENEIKSLLMRVNKENEKASLKLNIKKTKIMASGLITSWKIDGDKVELVTVLLSSGPKSLWTVTVEMKVKDACSLEESYDKIRQCIAKQRHHLANKSPYSPSYNFSSSHVHVWELDHKEYWTLKNWCFHTVVLEKTLESPFVSKDWS